MMSIADIAKQEGMCVETVRRWAKAAGFQLTRGRKNTTVFTPGQVNIILEQRRSKG